MIYEHDDIMDSFIPEDNFREIEGLIFLPVLIKITDNL